MTSLHATLKAEIPPVTILSSPMISALGWSLRPVEPSGPVRRAGERREVCAVASVPIYLSYSCSDVISFGLVAPCQTRLWCAHDLRPFSSSSSAPPEIDEDYLLY